MILDLNDYNINYNNKNNKYSLNSMAIHNGGLNSGHYYSVCKNYLDDNWYQYNDNHVSMVKEDELLNFLPYLLVYIRL